MSEPIISSVIGLDRTPCLLTPAEAAELTRPNGGGLGDWFAQYLANTPVANRKYTLRSFIEGAIPDGAYVPFAVADGIPIIYNHQEPDDPLNSVNRHMRFVIIAMPDSHSTNLHSAILERTLFIVANANPDGDGTNQNQPATLQCASWDPHALGKGMGMFRFYKREEVTFCEQATVEWMYAGNSFNAFKADCERQGPFCGHIGGALIMRQLTSPWTHWFDSKNVHDFERSLGSTGKAGSRCDPHNVLYDPLFTTPGGVAFSRLGRAEDLQPVVEASLAKWYKSRFFRDFLGQEHSSGLPKVSVVKQWAAHILLNRSINIAASSTSTAQVRAQQDVNRIPVTLFFNSHALQVLLPYVGPDNAFYITCTDYQACVNSLGLSLFYTTDPPRVAVEGSEGPFVFPIIEPGVEDYQGIRTLVQSSPTVNLLPAKAIAAMLMVDFYNPIYSARRAQLMRYIPDHAVLDAQTKTYNVLEQFVARIRESRALEDAESPENEILRLLSTPDNSYVKIFTARVNKYLAKVSERLQHPVTARSAVEDYMILAEGRRRLFRLQQGDGQGLNRIAITLPIATRPSSFPMMKMTETGNVELMAERETMFFTGGLPAMEGNEWPQDAKSPGGCPVACTRASDNLS